VITQDLSASCVVIRVPALIDQSFDRKKILTQAKGNDHLIFDLDRSKRITSSGVSEWMAMIKELRTAYHCFVMARPPMVAQFNMVMRFGGRGELVSAYAPYVCEDCGAESEVLFDFRRDRSFPPHVPCPACKGRAELDDLPETYFAHAAEAPVPAPPAIVDDVLGGALTKRHGPFRAEKKVEGGVTGIWLWGRLDERVRLKNTLHGLEGLVIADLSALAEMKGEGAGELAKSLTSAGVDVHLARVRLDVIAGIAKTRIGRDRARLFSVMLEHECKSCGWSGEIEALIGSIRGEAYCRACGQKAASPRLDARAEAALDKLLPSDHTEEVSAFLERHPNGPVAQGRRPRTRHKSKPRRGPSPASRVAEYQIVRRIGQGTMADVFLAKRQGHGFQKRVALKTIHRSLAADATFVELFLREAQLAARISHPNVVQILDFGKNEQGYYIAMEYVRGWNLDTVLGWAADAKVSVPVGCACRIVADVCAGLAAAHGNTADDGTVVPIIHRDVTPHNVLISHEGEVKLSDFGIAKAADSTVITDVGRVRGRLTHMAPERVSGGDDRLDPRVDVFSAGVLLFETLAQRPLFERPSQLEAMKAILTAEIPRLSSLRPDVPLELEQIAMRALARVPSERTASASELQAELEELLHKQRVPTSVAIIGPWVRALNTRSRKK
jgi:serine/threonine protein kinase